MTSLFPMFFSPLALCLLLLKEQQYYCVVCYVQPLLHRTNRHTSYSLQSSPNIFSGLISTSRSDDNDDDLDAKGYKYDRRNPKKEKKPQNKIKFVDFWGSKIDSNDENETTDPRRVPFVPTLDIRDGPLPPRAYIMEGKPEFDAKTTCRISIDVKTSSAMNDPDTVVRRLQDCLDAGFDTFQLHDQTSKSLDIIRRMNEDTPPSINKHWSIGLKIQSILPDPNVLSSKLDLRQTVLDLIEETGSDALDSLKVDCGILHTTNSIASSDIALEIFEHIVDLQREGWIRSIGVRNMESQKFRRDVMTYFGDCTDFEEREGSLLLPPFSSGRCDSKNNVRMANALAGGLLTDVYSNDRRRGKTSNHSSSRPQPLLTNDSMDLLKEWAKRHERQQTPASTLESVWKQYQEHVVGQLNWIAMKHDVSMSAVALRWALECGSTAALENTNGEGPIVSSALAEIAFEDEPNGDVAQKMVELRQVFRFELEKEDRDILFELSASQQDENEEEYPDIDFDNPILWL